MDAAGHWDAVRGSWPWLRDEAESETKGDSGHRQHCGSTENVNYSGFNGLVVMISVLHTEGLRFDPGLNHLFCATPIKSRVMSAFVYVQTNCVKRGIQHHQIRSGLLWYAERSESKPFNDQPADELVKVVHRACWYFSKSRPTFRTSITIGASDI